MAALGTYCFDGLNFSQASALYTDSTLTTLSPDGWYSQGNIIRQQLNGVLLNAQPCGTCLVACGSGVDASFSSNGFFSVLQLSPSFWPHPPWGMVHYIDTVGGSMIG